MNPTIISALVLCLVATLGKAAPEHVRLSRRLRRLSNRSLGSNWNSWRSKYRKKKSSKSSSKSNRSPKNCCRARSAKCLACVTGKSISEYCSQNPRTPDCPRKDPFSDYPTPPPLRAPRPTRAPICCRAYTAECMACSDQLSIEAFCRYKPYTPGCPRRDPFSSLGRSK